MFCHWKDNWTVISSDNVKLRMDKSVTYPGNKKLIRITRNIARRQFVLQTINMKYFHLNIAIVKLLYQRSILNCNMNLKQFTQKFIVFGLAIFMSLHMSFWLFQNFVILNT